MIDPGAYIDGLPKDAYDLSPRLRSTYLKEILRSPAHAQYAAANPTRSKSLDWGDWLHIALLEPERWLTGYGAGPPIKRNAKGGKQAWAEVQAENPDVVLIYPQEYDSILKARINAEKVIAELIPDQEYRTEVSGYWLEGLGPHQDEIPPLNMKTRPDILSADHRIMIDVKTTVDARPYPFRRDILKYKYHLQAYMYQRGNEVITGITPEFYFLVVEKSPPFGVKLYELSSEFKLAGFELFNKALTLYAECVESNQWPAYSIQPETLYLPE